MKSKSYVVGANRGVIDRFKNSTYGLSVLDRHKGKHGFNEKHYGFNTWLRDRLSTAYSFVVNNDYSIDTFPPEMLSIAARQRIITSEIDSYKPVNRIPYKLAELIETIDFTFDRNLISEILNWKPVRRLDEFPSYLEEFKPVKRKDEFNTHLEEFLGVERDLTFDTDVDEIDAPDRIIYEYESLVSEMSSPSRKEYVFRSDIDTITDVYRPFKEFLAHVETHSEGLVHTDLFESVIDYMLVSEMDSIVDSIVVDQTLGRLSAFDTDIPEYTLGTKLSDYEVNMTHFEHAGMLSDYPTIMDALDWATRDVTVDGAGWDIEWSRRDVTVGGLIVEDDKGIRDYTAGAFVDFTDRGSHHMTFPSAIYEYDTGIRDVLWDSMLEDTDNLHRAWVRDTLMDDFNWSTRDITWDTMFEKPDLFGKVSDYGTSMEYFDWSWRDETFDTTLEGIDGGTLGAIPGLLEEWDMFTRNYEPEAYLDTWKPVDRVSDYLTLVDEYTDVLRQDIRDALIQEQDIVKYGAIDTSIDYTEEFIKLSDFEAFIDSPGDFQRTAFEGWIDEIEWSIRDYEAEALVDELEDMLRNKIKPTTIIKQHQASMERILPTKVEVMTPGYRPTIKDTTIIGGTPADKIIVPRPVHLEKMTPAKRDTLKQAEVIKRDEGSRLNRKDASLLVHEEGVRNVINSAEVVKTMTGIRDNKKPAEIIDNNGNGGLVEEDKKIWLIMGKMLPDWNPWNWKKTRG